MSPSGRVLEGITVAVVSTSRSTERVEMSRSSSTADEEPLGYWRHLSNETVKDFSSSPSVRQVCQLLDSRPVHAFDNRLRGRVQRSHFSADLRPKAATLTDGHA